MKSVRVETYDLSYRLSALYPEGGDSVHLKGLPVDPAGILVERHIG